MPASCPLICPRSARPRPHRSYGVEIWYSGCHNCPRPVLAVAPSQALVVPVVRRGPAVVRGLTGRGPIADISWRVRSSTRLCPSPACGPIAGSHSRPPWCGDAVCPRPARPRPHRRTTQYRPDDLASATVRGLPGHGPIAAASVKRGLPGAWSVRGLLVTAPSWCACAYILGGANQTCPSPARSQPNRSDWIPGTRQILVGRVRGLPGRDPIAGP
jgi:hypothetical protein